jgi:predicted permease
MAAFGFELKQAARRVFTWRQTGAVLILTIGLALAAIMFAVGWGYSSFSLPYKDADRLVIAGYSADTGTGTPFLDDYQLFFDWKERGDVFTELTALRRNSEFFNRSFRTGNGSASFSASDVTTDFFDFFGVSFPGIQAWKEAANVKDPWTVAFTNDIGVNRFGYESIGKLFHGQGKTGGGIVPAGILPKNFVMPVSGANVFTPIELRPGDNGGIAKFINRDGTFTDVVASPLTVFARLAPGVTPQLAEQMLSGGSRGTYTNAFGNQFKLSVISLGDSIARQTKTNVLGTWAFGALILILCAANLGGILLTRCTYGLREHALRSALGATLSNLIRTLVLEICGIVVIATLIAAIIARAAMPAIAERVPVKLGAFGRPVFEWEALVFLIAAAAVVMFASIAPSIAVLARNYYKGFSQGILAVFRSHRALRISMIASQTAIAALLLCLSWMAVRAYSDVFFRDTGLNDKTRIITARYPTHYWLDGIRVDIYDTLDVLRRNNPGVRIAAFTGVNRGNLFTDKSPLASLPAYEKILTEQSAPENTALAMFAVTPDFFQTLDVKIMAGRDFNEGDLYERAVIVNEAFVRKMEWTPWDAIGREVTVGGQGKREIIGVCKDFLTDSWDSDIYPAFYAPFSRGLKLHPGGGGAGGEGSISGISYVIHSDDMRRVGNMGNIEKTIRELSPEVTILINSSWGEAQSGTARVRASSFATFCITLFAISGIAVVITGIVGTVKFIVERRTRDIAIQAAVGAPPYRVCWFVMKDMVIAGVSGALVGGIASWWVGKTVAHFIYDSGKYQNLTGLAIATVIMLVIIAAASLLPALRALRIEPARALNME